VEDSDTDQWFNHLRQRAGNKSDVPIHRVRWLGTHRLNINWKSRFTNIYGL